MTSTRIRAQLSPYLDRIEILLCSTDSEHRITHVAAPATLSPRDEGAPIEPTIHIPKEVAQILMDDLWHAGLRPSEGSGSAGSLRATEKHLEDMRTLVFAKIGTEKP